jgi:50S ribosomal subunit-associated GTPase HflX
VLNKVDAIDSKDVDEYRREFSEAGIELHAMSAATGDGVQKVLELVWSKLAES